MRSFMAVGKWISPLVLGALCLTALLVAPAEAGKVKPGARVAGGTVVDGSVGATLTSGKWTLQIPAGAFNGTATVTMTEVTAADGTPTVDLSISDPSLNSFRRPVWLSHKDKGNDAKKIFWWDPTNQVWVEVPGQLIALLDALGVEIKVPLFHFSTYSVKGGKAGW